MADHESSKIVDMPGVVRRMIQPGADGMTPEAEPEVVELLEVLLAEAKRGDILAISVALVCADCHPADTWAVGTRGPQSGLAGHMLVAATSYLTHRLTSSTIGINSYDAETQG